MCRAPLRMEWESRSIYQISQTSPNCITITSTTWTNTSWGIHTINLSSSVLHLSLFRRYDSTGTVNHWMWFIENSYYFNLPILRYFLASYKIALDTIAVPYLFRIQTWHIKVIVFIKRQTTRKTKYAHSRVSSLCEKQQALSQSISQIFRQLNRFSIVMLFSDQ